MSTELTLPQRAAVALGTAEHEVKLIALAKESTDITAVIDPAGRDQAHRIGMTLRAARTNITKTGKAARDDATAFGKAVITEEKRLVAIIEPEEERVLVLRDAFDAKVQAEKDAKIAAERARIEKIADAIKAIYECETDVIRICKSVSDTQESIKYLEDREITEDIYQERTEEAADIKAACLLTMRNVLADRIFAEAEAVRQQAEREVAEAQAKVEREELAAAQAKLKADQEAAATKQAAMLAEIEKNAAIERAAIAEQQRLIKAEQDRIAAEHAQKMAEQQAAMDVRQRDMDHAEGLMLNAQFDQLAAARKLEDETAAVVETVAADVVETPRTALDLLCDVIESAQTVRPADHELATAIADKFDVDYETAFGWLLEFGTVEF